MDKQAEKFSGKGVPRGKITSIGKPSVKGLPGITITSIEEEPMLEPNQNRTARSNLYGTGNTENPVLPKESGKNGQKRYSSRRVGNLAADVINNVCNSSHPNHENHYQRISDVKERDSTNVANVGRQSELIEHRFAWTVAGMSEVFKNPDVIVGLSFADLHVGYIDAVRSGILPPVVYTCDCKKKFFGLHRNCPIRMQIAKILEWTMDAESDEPDGLVFGDPAMSSDQKKVTFNVAKVVERQALVAKEVEQMLDTVIVPIANTFSELHDEADDVASTNEEAVCIGKIDGGLYQNLPLKKVDGVIGETREIEVSVDKFLSGKKYDPQDDYSSDDEVDVVHLKRDPFCLKKFFKKKSEFNMRTLINHHIGELVESKDQSKMDNLTISDNLIIDDLYMFLRKKQFESYPDRRSKLAHMTKLAAKWESETQYFKNNGGPVNMNCYWVTIGKVTDSKDTDFLLKEVNPEHSRNSIKIGLRRFFGRLNH